MGRPVKSTDYQEESATIMRIRRKIAGDKRMDEPRRLDVLKSLHHVIDELNKHLEEMPIMEFENIVEDATVEIDDEEQGL